MIPQFAISAGFGRSPGSLFFFDVVHHTRHHETTEEEHVDLTLIVLGFGNGSVLQGDVGVNLGSVSSSIFLVVCWLIQKQPRAMHPCI